MENSTTDKKLPADVLLEVKNLTTDFHIAGNILHANKQVSLMVKRGETLGIVGESGSGKSVLCRSILRLLPMPPANIASGEILLEEKDLLKLNDEQMRKIRGTDVTMIFQDPMTCLNPVIRIENQVTESMLLHGQIQPHQRRETAIRLLEQVGIPSPEKRIADYPHQLSGGMRQRIMIAMAISTKPRLLLADEPTTALDVTIQDQILALMMEVQVKVGMSVILVSHDMGVIAETSDHVAVMYAGQVMEYATTQEIFNHPRHPYTVGLLESIPRMTGGQKRLIPIQGQPPNLLKLPPGCPFVDRCRIAEMQTCSNTPIRINEIASGHFSSCLFPERVSA